MLPGNERARMSQSIREKEMRIVFGWAEASWLSVSLAFSYEVPLCSGCPRPRGSFLSSFPPFHLFLIPPFPLSPFLLSFSSLLDSSLPCLAYVPVSSRDLDLGTAWPVLPCAMPYPTTRLIEENVRRFVLSPNMKLSFSHCRNFVRWKITDRKFKIIFSFRILFPSVLLIWN